MKTTVLQGLFLVLTLLCGMFLAAEDDSPVLTRTELVRLAREYLKKGKDETALQMQERQEKIRKRIRGSRCDITAEVLNVTGAGEDGPYVVYLSYESRRQVTITRPLATGFRVVQAKSKVPAEVVKLKCETEDAKAKNLRKNKDVRARGVIGTVNISGEGEAVEVSLEVGETKF